MPINGVVTLPPSEPIAPALSAMPPFSVSDIRKRTNAVQEIMRGVMKEGTHFGTIPGTPKPSLWKAGAEVLCMTFRLAPMLDSRVVADDLDSERPYTATKRDGSVVQGTTFGFFEVEAICTIHSFNGEVLSRCSARCNNREAKYRSLSLFEIRNTILKMAEKRAFVSAVLMTTAASDIFTQDLEDLPELIEQVPPKPLRENPKPTHPTIGKAGQGLTPKREAWLFRAATEANLSKEALEHCLGHLRTAAPEVVKAFFDDLAMRKQVFDRFLGPVA
jgi:hypothetical protein